MEPDAQRLRSEPSRAEPREAEGPWTDLLRAAIERFESVRRTGQPVNLQSITNEVLQGSPLSESARLRFRCDLVKEALSRGWRGSGSPAAEPVRTPVHQPAEPDVAETGPRPRLEELLAQFPDARFDDETLVELSAHEFRVRQESGQTPEIEEFEGRFDHLASALRNRLGKVRDDVLLESSIRTLLYETDPWLRLERSTTTDDAAPTEAGNDAAAKPANAGDDGGLADLLKRVELFSELSPEVRAAVSAKMRLRAFDADDVLVRQGEVADCLLILLEGVAQVTVVDRERTHAIGRLGRHTVIGEIGLLTHEARTANVVAESAGLAATIARDDFEQLAGRYPRLSIALSELVARRVGTLAIDALCGKTIGGYIVRQRMGRGAMGIVYAALEEAGGRAVALKMLRHDRALDRLSSERFRFEAEIVRSLRNAHIVQVYEEFCAFGTSFIAMELCDGPSLPDLIARTGPLPLPIVRSLIGQVADGLLCAHRAGIAHRDLKPSNVTLTRSGEAKLADFGLARSMADDVDGLTLHGEFVGTPKYMAPEQLDGERGDQRSDFFSLGCIVFELLSGRPMFRAMRWNELVRERSHWLLPAPAAIRSDMDDCLYDLLRDSLLDDPRDRSLDLAELAKWASPVDWSAIACAADILPAPPIAAD